MQAELERSGGSAASTIATAVVKISTKFLFQGAEGSTTTTWRRSQQEDKDYNTLSQMERLLAAYFCQQMCRATWRESPSPAALQLQRSQRAQAVSSPSQRAHRFYCWYAVVNRERNECFLVPRTGTLIDTGGPTEKRKSSSLISSSTTTTGSGTTTADGTTPAGASPFVLTTSGRARSSSQLQDPDLVRRTARRRPSSVSRVCTPLCGSSRG
ncbi:unnamed protein product, partial [Amoebophrya sp. A25]|eukprot:GSA25T00019842001.1